VAGASTGTPCLVNFRASGIVLTDRSQNTDAGGVPVRIVGYTQVEIWHVGTGLWGFTSGGIKRLFATPEVEAMRAEIEKRVTTRIFYGICGDPEEVETKPVAEIQAEVEEKSKVVELWSSATPAEKQDPSVLRRFEAMAQPLGIPVVVVYTTDSVQVTDPAEPSTALRSLQYDEIQEWDAEPERELFSIRAKGRLEQFVALKSEAMRELLIANIKTITWHGYSSKGIVHTFPDGSTYSVAKSPLGTPATLQFKAHALVITDRTQVGIKGGVPVREVPYGDIQVWHVGLGTWGIELQGGLELEFATEEIEAIRADFDKRIECDRFAGSCQLPPPIDNTPRSLRRLAELAAREERAAQLARLQQEAIDTDEKWTETQNPKSFVNVLMQPSGATVLIRIGNSELSVLQSGVQVLSVPYSQLESWEATTHTWHIGARSRIFQFISEQSPALMTELCRRVVTRDWRGKVQQPPQNAGDGNKFRVMKAPLGTAASVEFKADRLIIIDQGQHTLKKGRLVAQEYPFSEVTGWSSADGAYSVELGDRKFDFLTDQVDAMRANMLEHFPGNIVLHGSNFIAQEAGNPEEGPLPIEVLEEEQEVQQEIEVKQRYASPAKPTGLAEEFCARDRRFPAYALPSGQPILLIRGETVLRVTTRENLGDVVNEFPYAEIKNCSFEDELLSFCARGREFSFSVDDAFRLQQQIASLVEFGKDGPAVTSMDVAGSVNLTNH